MSNLLISKDLVNPYEFIIGFGLINLGFSSNIFILSELFI